MNRSFSSESGMSSAKAPFGIPVAGIVSRPEFSRWCEYARTSDLRPPFVRTGGYRHEDSYCVRIQDDAPFAELPPYAFKFLEEVTFSYNDFGKVDEFEAKRMHCERLSTQKENALAAQKAAREAMQAYFDRCAEDDAELEKLSDAYVKSCAAVRSRVDRPEDVQWLADMRPLHDAAALFFGGYWYGPRLLAEHVYATEKGNAKAIWDKVPEEGKWSHPYYFGQLNKVESVSPGDYHVYSNPQNKSGGRGTFRCYVLLESKDLGFWWIAICVSAGTYELLCVRADCFFKWDDAVVKPRL
jgi:hypothetical protein